MDLKIFTENIEEKALEQINTLMAQPAFKDCKVRIMPDVHAGAGCVIGFTADLGDKVIPNIVGVDIGCGMLTVPLGNIKIDYEKLDDVINEHIPNGMDVHEDEDAAMDFRCRFALSTLYCYDQLKNKDWLERSLGTLGGGNHFIEVDADDEGNKYLVIHTGSRNIGKQVADIWQGVAVSRMCGKERFKQMQAETIARLKAEGNEKQISLELKRLKRNYDPEMNVPKELCYLTGKEREFYLHDMKWCQCFAHWNRRRIAEEICRHMGKKWNGHLDDWFETVHNYIDHESNIVRKGAISAKKGERVLIPMNMRDGCIIGVGKGNEDWNCSAPHGAGRMMSRAEAKRRVTLDEYAQAMKGIYTTSVGLDTIDESPMAYKPMNEILKNIEPTVEIERIIKPVYNFKASE